MGGSSSAVVELAADYEADGEPPLDETADATLDVSADVTGYDSQKRNKSIQEKVRIEFSRIRESMWWRESGRCTGVKNGKYSSLHSTNSTGILTGDMIMLRQDRFILWPYSHILGCATLPLKFFKKTWIFILCLENQRKNPWDQSSKNLFWTLRSISRTGNIYINHNYN